MSAFDAVDGAHSTASKCYRLVASKPERFKEVSRQKLNAGAAAIRPLAFQGALGRAAPTRLCGVDGRDCPTRASMQPETRSMAQP
jgi:hypothetical protein